MKAGKLGALSAVTASLCCLGPVVLAAVGLSGLGAGVFFTRFSRFLVVTAVVLLALGWRQYIAEASRCKKTHCQMSGGKAALMTLFVASMVVAGFTIMHLWPLATQAACAVSCPRQP